ncbi:MAG: NAD-dependent epimerase/dehydratase family protein [Pyrinomonadaceae bacterium]
MAILVTGGAGYIGSVTVEMLRAKGPTGSRPGQSRLRTQPGGL